MKGWKGPCYLITDAHHKTFEELMTQTPWENYGTGNDPRCEHCMMHCGYEPSAALGINPTLIDNFKTADLGVALKGGSPLPPVSHAGHRRPRFIGWHVARAANGDKDSSVRALWCGQAAELRN